LIRLIRSSPLPVHWEDAMPVVLSLGDVRFLRPQARSTSNESSVPQGPGPTVMVALPAMPLTVSVRVRV
jgi:hypothetical protein